MADTRERILEATRALWNERGFLAVPVADIAAEVGISTGNLSYHFPAKRDLVLALFDRAEKAHLELVREWEPGTALEELPGWIRALCGAIWEHRFLYRDTPHLVLEAPTLARRGRETLAAEGRRQFGAGIEALVAAGDLRIAPDDQEALVTTGWILVRHWIDYLVEARGVERIRRRHVEALVTQYLALLGPHLTPAARRRLPAGV
jgi:AcrR family transcriptional regulator